MKKIFLLLSMIVGFLSAKPQLYIIEKGNLIKVTKTILLNKEKGIYIPVNIKDTLGQGDFDIIPLPSKYLKTLAETGTVSCQDTVLVNSEPYNGLFLREMYRRDVLYEKDEDSYYFAGSQKLIPLGREFSPLFLNSLVILFVLLFALFLFFLYFKKIKIPKKGT